MHTPTVRQLSAYMDRLTDRIQEMRRLNLSTEDEWRLALEQSRDLQALLSMYRHTLKHALTDLHNGQDASLSRAA